MPETPAGYTGAEVLEEIKATGYEPQEIAEAKDTVHDVLDSWEYNRGLTFADGDGIELADEIVTKLIAAGAVFPEQKVNNDAGGGIFDHIPEAGVPADFESIISPMGKHLPWGVSLSGRSHGLPVAVDIGHTLFYGPTGGGKTLALQVLALSALSRGYDITVIDLAKGGVDWQWLAADAEIITTASGAQATLTEVQEEDRRVVKLLHQLDKSNFNILTPEELSTHDVRRRLIILDGTLEPVASNTVSPNDEYYALRTPINRMLAESRAAGVTVVGSFQGDLSHLPTNTRTNFASQIGFGSSGLVAAADDGHDVPESLPAGTTYVRPYLTPGEFAAQVWMTSVEELIQKLPAVRKARQEILDILYGADEESADA